MQQSMKAGAWLAANTPRWLMPSTVALSVADGIVIVAQAGLIAKIAVGAFVAQRALIELMPGMWLLLAVLLLRAVLGGVRQRLAAGASAHARLDLRGRLLAAIEAQGPVRMAAAGSLMTTFDEQVEALDAYYARYVPQRIAAMVIPPLVVISVLAGDWLAGLLLLLTAPLIPLFMILIGIGARDLARKQFRSMARLGGWFLDQVRGAATIRLFQAEPRVIAQVSDRTDALRRETMRVLRLAFLSSAVLEFFSAIAIASVAIYVGLGLLGYLSFGPAPNLTLGSGLFVLLLAPEFFQPIRALSQGWHDRADAHAAVDEIRAVIHREPARPLAEPDFSPTPSSRCRVEICALSFAHEDRKPIFHDIDLDIPPGQRLVLVGPSGGGKSTLIGLLAGFLQPGGGSIRLDGQPFARFSEAARVAHVAWLGQQPVLFAGTIAENIGLGWQAAGVEEIRRIAEAAFVLEFADRFEDGLNTRIGEGGHGLSGGQAQRIALARALLRPRPLILLDEPTASLDPDSERRVLAALERLLESRPATVVCASHRAATMSWANRVIEIDGGQLRERRP